MFLMKSQMMSRSGGQLSCIIDLPVNCSIDCYIVQVGNDRSPRDSKKEMPGTLEIPWVSGEQESYSPFLTLCVHE